MSQVTSVGLENVVAFAVQPSPGAATAGTVMLYADSTSGFLTAIDSNGTTYPLSKTSEGTVTSVALVDSTGLFTVTGSPVTGAGTLTLSAFASQNQNLFLASPNGSSGAPAFRAVVAADLPSTLTSGTAITNAALTTPALGVATGTSVNVTKDLITGLNAMGNVTGATNADLSLGNVISMTLTGAATFTWTNGTASRGTEFTFVVTQDGTGGRIITWPAQVAGITPLLDYHASGVSVFKGVYDGTNMNWVGVQNSYPQSNQTALADTVSAPNNTTTNFATSYTFPPSAFDKAGTLYKVTLGMYLTTSGGALTTSFRSTLGGQGCVSYTSANQATTITNRMCNLEIYLYATAAPGASVEVTAVPGAGNYIASSSGAPFDGDTISQGTVTVATNGSLVFQPQFQASVNTAGNSLTLKTLSVQRLA